MKKSPDAHDFAVGHRIRAQRIERRMSQEKLGEALGVTFQQIQKYEKGKNRVGAGRLKRISEVLEVPVSFFFDGHVTPAQEKKNGATDGFSFLTNARALRLMKAYTRIKNPKTQQALVDLVEQVANDGERGR